MGTNSLKGNYIVEKSNDFIMTDALSKCDATMLKAMDIYMSCINAREPEKREISFTKQAFCRLMGIDRNAKLTSLKNALCELQSAVISFPISYLNDNGKVEYKGTRSVTLFTTSEIVTDVKTGANVIVMKCNDDAKDLFFQLQKKGYTRYMVQNSVRLSSKYAILLYNLLKMEQGLQHSDKAIAIYDLQDLRKRLGALDKTNAEFKYFKRLLVKCCEDINNNTDINVVLEPIYEGRFVKQMGFSISTHNIELPFPDSNVETNITGDREPVLFHLTPVVGKIDDTVDDFQQS